MNSTSISVFKCQLSSVHAFAHCTRSLVALQYSKIVKGHTGRLITQFRLGLSPLRYELFTYNITDNPFCPSCGESLECLLHFLFECSCYSQQRCILLNDLKTLFTHININFNLTLDIGNHEDVKNILINGVNLPMIDDNISINAAIFHIASTYISSSARFTQHIWVVATSIL